MRHASRNNLGNVSGGDLRLQKRLEKERKGDGDVTGFGSEESRKTHILICALHGQCKQDAQVCLEGNKRRGDPIVVCLGTKLGGIFGNFVYTNIETSKRN